MSVPRTPLWWPIEFSKCRRQRGFAPLGAQSVILVWHPILKLSTSTRIRTRGSPERYSRATSHFQNDDVNVDSRLLRSRTLFWSDLASAKCRRRRGFAPLGAQNAIQAWHSPETNGTLGTAPIYHALVCGAPDAKFVLGQVQGESRGFYCPAIPKRVVTDVYRSPLIPPVPKAGGEAWRPPGQAGPKVYPPPRAPPTPLPTERTKSNFHTSFLSTHGLVISLSRLSATIQGRSEYALPAPPAPRSPPALPARRNIPHAAGLVLGVRGHP